MARSGNRRASHVFHRGPAEVRQRRVFWPTNDYRPGPGRGPWRCNLGGGPGGRRFKDLGFAIIWEGVDAGKPKDPATPPGESFKIEDPDGIEVDVSGKPDHWPRVGIDP